MSILERRKLKAATMVLSAPVAALAILGIASRTEAGPIAAGDILVDQGGSGSGDPVGAGASSLLIQELNPSLTAQTSPVQSFNISSESSPLYTNSNGSNGMLSLSNDATVVSFGGYVGTNSNELAQNTRAVGTLDANGNYTRAATYNESATAGNGQVRSAYSPDGSTWYFGDKDGVYLVNTNAPANTTNVRALKGYGSTLYASFQGNANTPALYTVSSNGTTLTAISGITGNKNLTDFVLLQSGENGSTYDSAYLAEGTTIAKYSFNGTTWSAEGTITAAASINGLTGMEIGGDAGVDLYYTTTASAYSVVDSAAGNVTAVGGTSTNLYTAPTGTALFGVSLAPVAAPEPASLGLLGLGCLGLLRRRRRSSNHLD